MAKRTKLACPKCHGTTFEVYHVEVEDFFPPELGGPTSLYFTLEVCTNCRWESNVTDVPSIKHRIKKMFERVPDWVGFEISEKQ